MEISRVRISRIRTEYGDLQSKSPYSVAIWENAGQKNSVFGHFSHSANQQKFIDILKSTDILYYIQASIITS